MLSGHRSQHRSFRLWQWLFQSGKGVFLQMFSGEYYDEHNWAVRPPGVLNFKKLTDRAGAEAKAMRIAVLFQPRVFLGYSQEVLM